jgi:hypothetical protein
MKFANTIATLATETSNPMKNPKASLLPERACTRKGSGAAEALELAKVVKKIMISKRLKSREA